MRVLVFAIAFWVVMLPLKILEVFGKSLPEWVVLTIAVLIFVVYLPFAAYFTYHLVIDLNKTDHKFVPLLEKLRNKRDGRGD